MSQTNTILEIHCTLILKKENLNVTGRVEKFPIGVKIKKKKKTPEL